MCKLEYLRLDAGDPTQKMRSKTKILDESKFSGKVEDCPLWSFDGSSTNQAEWGKSDCLLQPVNLFPDPSRQNGYLVVCEVLNPDHTPHITNARAKIVEDNDDFWFGFEQEYVFWDIDHHTPLGFPAQWYYPPPQGPYYCSIGAEYAVGREIVEEHMDLCIGAGLGITGVNAEVLKWQWEYQIFAKWGKEAADQVRAARYFLEKIAEKYEIRINLDPKPVEGDWNGSGMHVNFSNSTLRKAGRQETFEEICEKFGVPDVIEEHIAVYGHGNHERLTGQHETQSLDKFSYGVSDRWASIRIPISVVENGWNGYLEDRRPASNANPYEVAAVIMKTVNS